MIEERDLSFLKDLISAPSPTGSEAPCAEVLRQRLDGVADEVTTNVMGSVHAVLKGTGDGPSVMLAGHIDEVGLMVTYIDDKGYCYFQPLGGVDAAILPGMRIDVHTADGPLRGIVGRMPIHLLEADDRKKVTPIDKLFLDLGMPAETVKEKVRIGDPATYAVGFEEYGDGMAVSRAFDDKLGVWVCARVLEEVKKAGGAVGDLICAGTVQEEIGMRGGKTSAYGLDPVIGMAIEATHATDYPSVDPKACGECLCGKGPVIGRGPNINPVLFDLLVAAAEKEGVPYQIGPENRGTGTDANVIQLSRGGKVAGVVSVGLRYMHTPTEVLALEDLESTVKMLTRFVLDLEPNQDFTPRV